MNAREKVGGKNERLNKGRVLAMEQSAAKTALHTLVEVVEAVGVDDVEVSVGEDSAAKHSHAPSLVVDVHC
eukprot:5014753-Amphidinium_carterae.1